MTGEKTIYNKLLFKSYGELIKEGKIDESELENRNILIEIIFHIAPFLPFSPFDSQQSDKKRYIGNDVVVVIFRDCFPNQVVNPMDPSIFKSQVKIIFFTQEKKKKKYFYTKIINKKNK